MTPRAWTLGPMATAYGVWAHAREELARRARADAMAFDDVLRRAFLRSPELYAQFVKAFARHGMETERWPGEVWDSMGEAMERQQEAAR